MNWILKNVMESVANVLEELTEEIMQMVNEVFLSAGSIGDTSMISNITGITTGLSLTLLGAMVSKQIFSTYILETDGDPESDPLTLLTRAAIAVALICCNGIIFNLLLDMATAFGNSIIVGVDQMDLESSLANAIFNITSGRAVIMIFVLVFVICLIILCVKGGIRGAELALMKILFPLFCLDIIKTSREKWNAFFTTYLITFFGYTLQILSLRISCQYFNTYATSGGTNILWSLAWLFLALKAPKWLEKFCYSSGMGQSVSGAGRSAMYMMPSIMKGMK